MSVLITGKIQGDTAKFRQALVDRAAPAPPEVTVTDAITSPDQF